MPCCRRPNARSAAMRDVAPMPRPWRAARRRSTAVPRVARAPSPGWPQCSTSSRCRSTPPTTGATSGRSRRSTSRHASAASAVSTSAPWTPSWAPPSACTRSFPRNARAVSCACPSARWIAFNYSPCPGPARRPPPAARLPAAPRRVERGAFSMRGWRTGRRWRERDIEHACAVSATALDTRPRRSSARPGDERSPRRWPGFGRGVGLAMRRVPGPVPDCGSTRGSGSSR